MQDSIHLTSQEWHLVGNALNEVLHGLVIPEFERTIGMSRADAEAILAELWSLPRDIGFELDLHLASYISNALSSALSGMSPEDFSTRTGYTLEEAKSLRKRLNPRGIG